MRLCMIKTGPMNWNCNMVGLTLNPMYLMILTNTINIYTHCVHLFNFVHRIPIYKTLWHIIFPIWITYITFINSYNINQSFNNKDNELSIPTFKAYAGSTHTETDQNIKARHTRNILRQDRNHEFTIDPSAFPVALDSAASYTYSGFNKDFTKIKPLTGINIDGIGSGLTAAGYGTIKYFVTDDDGFTREMTIKRCLYVPGLKLRLLSPQHFLNSIKCNNSLFTVGRKMLPSLGILLGRLYHLIHSQTCQA